MKKLALSLSLALAALAAPALANTAEAVSVTVRTSDLDLASDAGVQSLYQRIERAARKACAGLDTRSAATQVEYRECRATAVDGAVLAANHEALTSLHVAKTGGVASTVASK
jgi:UrcA family protein